MLLNVAGEFDPMRFTFGTRVRIHINGILINGDLVPDQTRTLLRSRRCYCVGVEDGYDNTSKLLSRGVRSVDSVQLAGSAVGGWAQEIPSKKLLQIDDEVALPALVSTCAFAA